MGPSPLRRGLQGREAASRHSLSVYEPFPDGDASSPHQFQTILIFHLPGQKHLSRGTYNCAYSPRLL